MLSTRESKCPHTIHQRYIKTTCRYTYHAVSGRRWLFTPVDGPSGRVRPVSIHMSAREKQPPGRGLEPVMYRSVSSSIQKRRSTVCI